MTSTYLVSKLVRCGKYTQGELSFDINVPSIFHLHWRRGCGKEHKGVSLSCFLDVLGEWTWCFNTAAVVGLH